MMNRLDLSQIYIPSCIYEFAANIQNKDVLQKRYLREHPRMAMHVVDKLWLSNIQLLKHEACHCPYFGVLHA